MKNKLKNIAIVIVASFTSTVTFANSSFIEPLLEELDQGKSNINILCENYYGKIFLDITRKNGSVTNKYSSYHLNYNLVDRIGNKSYLGSATGYSFISVPNNRAGDLNEELAFRANTKDELLKEIIFHRETNYIGNKFEVWVEGVVLKRRGSRGIGSASAGEFITGVAIENCKRVGKGE